MIIQCDFDGTIITNNLSILIREYFAPRNWQDMESDYLRGNISVERSNKFQFELIREPKVKLQEFICQHITLRAGFIDFVNYCTEVHLPLVIVSSGLDFYIEAVLKKIGLPNLELHCAKTTFLHKGIDVSYYSPEGNLINEGFKSCYYKWLQKRGGDVIYIGDDLSDLNAALKAKHVFATGDLQSLLDRESTPYYSYSDFHYILQVVKRL